MFYTELPPKMLTLSITDSGESLWYVLQQKGVCGYDQLS